MCRNEEHGRHHHHHHEADCECGCERHEEHYHGCGCGEHRSGHDCGCSGEHGDTCCRGEEHGHEHSRSGCGGGGHRRHLRRRFYFTREERIAWLEEYLKDLQAETTAVEEQLAELRAT